MPHYRIRRFTTSLVLAHGAGANTVTNSSLNLNGILKKIKVYSPASVDGSATLTITIKDADGDTLWSKASIAANTKDITLLTRDQEVPLTGLCSVTVLFSANQTATDTTTQVILVIQDQ